MLFVGARLAQSVERKALNLVVVGSSPTVGVYLFACFLFCFVYSLSYELLFLCKDFKIRGEQKKRRPSPTGAPRSAPEMIHAMPPIFTNRMTARWLGSKPNQHEHEATWSRVPPPPTVSPTYGPCRPPLACGCDGSPIGIFYIPKIVLVPPPQAV
jgi:hypothetical protein